MSPRDAADLLTLLSALDSRIEVNPATALSWSFALQDLPLDVARQAVKALVDAGEAYRFTPQAISKAARPFMQRLATDVRSAKLRNLVPADWPPTRPLSDEVAARLSAEWFANNDREALPAVPTSTKEIEQ